MVLVSVVAIGTTGCTDSKPTDRLTVVVSYSILGDIVSQLVGQAANVQVIIPNGVDPHEFEPSAKNVETINGASLIVTNGAGLEEHLVRIIDQAKQNGVLEFVVADHVTTQSMTDDGKEVVDPHIWLDPLTILQAIPDLAQQLGALLHLDLAANAVKVKNMLTELNAETTAIMSDVNNCTLVAGHDEMGYFAARFGCTVVGAIIPSLSTSAEATAGQIAELKRLASKSGVRAIFADHGAPTQVADQLAQELSVQLVVLTTHMLEDGDNYSDFVLRFAHKIADSLD